MTSYDDHANRHLLTEALLQLPAVVGQPDPGDPPLNQQVRRIESRVGNVAAAQYAERAAHRAISRVRTLGIERARIVLAPGESQPSFHDAMAEAVEHGLITQEELDDLTATDIILRGGNRRHVVIEASLVPRPGRPGTGTAPGQGSRPGHRRGHHAGSSSSRATRWAAPAGRQPGSGSAGNSSLTSE